jgi:orotate phosphoribosyltransferase
MDRILRNHRHFLAEGHFLYPADENGAHLLRFFTTAFLIRQLPFLDWIANDVLRWIESKGIQYDVIFAPAEQGVKNIVEDINWLSARSGRRRRRSAFWEYLPSGRFGDHLVEGKVKRGDRVLVLNGVTQTGRCVGQRLPSFVESLGGEVVGAAVFAKGTNSLVGECELKYGSKFYSAIQVDIPVFSPNECPICLRGGRASLRPWTDLTKNIKI